MSLHTGQHYDNGLSQVFFEELGLRRPRTGWTCARPIRSDAARPRRRARGRAAGPDARLRRHELDARGREGGRGGRDVAGPRRGRPAQRRPLHAGGAEPHRGRPARRRCSSARTNVRARRSSPRASAGASRSSATSWPTPTGSSRRWPASAIRLDARAGDRTSSPPCTGRRTSRSRRLGRIVDGPEPARGARRLPGPPANARGVAGRPAAARAARRARRAARLPRPRRARLAGARDRHGLRRPAEGGVLVRRPLRDAAAVDGVGGHSRGRRERRSSTTTRSALAAAVAGARLPADAAAALRRRPCVGANRRDAGRVGSTADDAGRGHRRRRLRRRPARAGVRRGGPLASLLVDVDAERVDAAEPRREPHRGRPLGGAERLVDEQACARRPTTTSCATPTRS